MTIRDAHMHSQTGGAVPHPALSGLGALVGTWDVAAPGLSGRITFEWMDGGHFLMCFSDLHRDAEHVTGLEVIGFDTDAGQIRSHYYETTGAHADYTWRIEGGGFHIAGPAGEYSGTFDPMLVELTGVWRGSDGDVESTLTRIE